MVPGMVYSPLRSRKAGFSLIELLIVVSIIGLVMLFTFPRAAAVYDHTMVRGARTAVTNMYLNSRSAARTANKTAVFRLSGDQVWVETNNYAPLTTKVVVRQPVDLGDEYGVTVTGEDSLRVDPRGVIKGETRIRKWIISRNGWSDSVMVNGYGRVLR